MALTNMKGSQSVGRIMSTRKSSSTSLQQKLMDRLRHQDTILGPMARSQQINLKSVVTQIGHSVKRNSAVGLQRPSIKSLIMGKTGSQVISKASFTKQLLSIKRGRGTEQVNRVKQLKAKAQLYRQFSQKLTQKRKERMELQIQQISLANRAGMIRQDINSKLIQCMPLMQHKEALQCFVQSYDSNQGLIQQLEQLQQANALVLQIQQSIKQINEILQRRINQLKVKELEIKQLENASKTLKKYESRQNEASKLLIFKLNQHYTQKSKLNRQIEQLTKILNHQQNQLKIAKSNKTQINNFCQSYKIKLKTMGVNIQAMISKQSQVKTARHQLLQLDTRIKLLSTKGMSQQLVRITNTAKQKVRSIKQLHIQQQKFESLKKNLSVEFDDVGEALMEEDLAMTERLAGGQQSQWLDSSRRRSTNRKNKQNRQSNKISRCQPRKLLIV